MLVSSLRKVTLVVEMLVKDLEGALNLYNAALVAEN